MLAALDRAGNVAPPVGEHGVQLPDATIEHGERVRGCRPHRSRHSLAGRIGIIAGRQHLRTHKLVVRNSRGQSFRVLEHFRSLREVAPSHCNVGQQRPGDSLVFITLECFDGATPEAASQCALALQQETESIYCCTSAVETMGGIGDGGLGGLGGSGYGGSGVGGVGGF